MLTYTFENSSSKPLYKQLYDFIRTDIVSGKLRVSEHLPSKRTFADHLGVSMITVETSYAQLMSEGYIYSVPKKGFYVADISFLYTKKASSTPKANPVKAKEEEKLIDFSDNQTNPDIFPFTVWAKLMREVISLQNDELMTKAPFNGVYELREAIAGHLSGFRGINVNPDNIIVGAGTEYLYGLLVVLLGRDKLYCVENPGYKKIKQVYENNLASCVTAGMDEGGIILSELIESGADIVHISPTHHFPTGITTPMSRRLDLLNWAHSQATRYIVEDEYDSEFRLVGRPIPALKSIDSEGKVIYINTFSKSLTPTIRVSYMVLPDELMERFKLKFGNYSCTVSNFEQYALARFLGEGYFEKHINRMRLYYTKQRDALINAIENSPIKDLIEIILQDSGLHFLIKLNTDKSDEEVESICRSQGIILKSIKNYYYNDTSDSHTFIVNYSNISVEKVSSYFGKLKI